MPMRVGLVGAGRRARNIYAPGLSRCPNISFVGLWSRSPRAAVELAAAHGVTNFDRYDRLLDSCDAVAFAVPPAVQADLAATAALRGKPVLLETPIAGDVAGAESLAAAVTSEGVVSQVALICHYAAAVRQFLTLEVTKTHPQGGSGRLMSNAFAAASSAPPWRKERGVLRILGVHLIDVLDAALGRVVDVRAHGDMQGWIGLQLEHERGRFSDASMSGTVDVDPARADVEIFGPGGAAAIDCFAAVGSETYETMFSEFATAAGRGEPHELDVRRGLHLQHVVDAAETDLLRSQPTALGGIR
jgi:predicted dehydrogenase